MKRIAIILLLTTCTAYGYWKNKTSSATCGEDQPQATKTIKQGRAEAFSYGSSVYRILAARTGDVWFCTSQGVYRYDGKFFTNYASADGLSFKNVTSIMEDKTGNTWLGAEGGVCWFDGKKFNSILLPVTDMYDPSGILAQAGLKNTHPKEVARVFEDRAGNIWFYSHYDIYRYDGRSGSAKQTGLSNYIRTEVWPNTRDWESTTLYNVYVDKKGSIWFTTGGCGYIHETYRLDARRADHPCVLNNCKHDLQKPLDLAAHNREIAASYTKVVTKTGDHSISYTSVLEDKAGNFWFGSYDSGVYRYDGSNFIHFPGQTGMYNSSVAAIFEDRAGKIWFCCYNGGGVFRYDPSTSHKAGVRSLTHYTTKDGLCNKGAFADNTVRSIAEDNAGKLWFGGPGGISSYNGRSFTSYSIKDGLYNDQVEAMVKDKAGNIWFGTLDMGLMRYEGRSFAGFTEKQ